MRASKSLAIGTAAIAVATALVVPVVRMSRGVRPVVPVEASERNPFDPAQSAAVFVGVRRFDDSQTPEVLYAVDDAIDLAYMMAFDRRVRLVLARRIVLLLSGKPVKRESRRKRDELRASGAVIVDAGASDILKHLRLQAEATGRDGILIVSLATHGFVRDGIPYILGSTSSIRDPETAVSAAKIFDIAASAPSRRSLIFVDACRERIQTGTRAAGPDPMTAAPLIRRMTNVSGQVIFHAAAVGGYAYDAEGNGIFTKSVLEGLSCSAATIDGVVTAETLHQFLEKRVGTWVRTNHDASLGAATQFVTDGRGDNMPLSRCWVVPDRGPVRASHDGSSVDAFRENGSRAWRRDAGARVVVAPQVADLDADGITEVVVGVENGIVVFDADGARLWEARDEWRLRTFAVGDLERNRTRELVALFAEADSPTTRLAIFDSRGRRTASSDQPARLLEVAIDRETTRHGAKIVLRTAESLIVFRPRHVTGRKVEGTIVPSSPIVRFEIGDRNGDGDREIAVTTAAGETFLIDFKAKPIGRRAKEAP